MAPNLEILIAMRVVQALGAAALLANGNVITLGVFPKAQHAMALGPAGALCGVQHGFHDLPDPGWGKPDIMLQPCRLFLSKERLDFPDLFIGDMLPADGPQSLDHQSADLAHGSYVLRRRFLDCSLSSGQQILIGL